MHQVQQWRLIIFHDLPCMWQNLWSRGMYSWLKLSPDEVGRCLEAMKRKAVLFCLSSVFVMSITQLLYVKVCMVCCVVSWKLDFFSFVLCFVSCCSTVHSILSLVGAIKLSLHSIVLLHVYTLFCFRNYLGLEYVCVGICWGRWDIPKYFSEDSFCSSIVLCVVWSHILVRQQNQNKKPPPTTTNTKTKQKYPTKNSKIQMITLLSPNLWLNDQKFYL